MPAVMGVGLEEVDEEVAFFGMARFEALAGGEGEEWGVVVDDEGGSEGGFAPAEADHVVVRRPVQKSIVRGVVHDEAAAIVDVADEDLSTSGASVCRWVCSRC